MDGESFNFDNTDIEFLASMYASAKLSANTSPIMHIIVSIPRDKKNIFIIELNIISTYIPIKRHFKECHPFYY